MYVLCVHNFGNAALNTKLFKILTWTKNKHVVNSSFKPEVKVLGTKIKQEYLREITKKGNSKKTKFCLKR